MAREKLTPTRYPGVFRTSSGRLVARVGAVHVKTRKYRERRQTLPEGASLADARALAVELAEVARGDRESVTYPTLTAFARLWLDRKRSRGDWRDGSTSAAYTAGTLERHIAPYLGDILIDRLETRDLVAWMDTQMASGAKPNTIRTRWGTLQGLVSEACSDYGLPDITRGVRPPKRPARGGEDMVLMPEQLHEVLAWVEAKRPAWSALFTMGFASGARIGELCLIQIGDLDLSGDVGKWTIRRHYGLNDTIVPGSKAGPERTIYIDPVSTERLRPLADGRFGAEWLTVLPRRPRRPERVPVRNDSGIVFRALSKAVGITLTSKTFRQTHTTLSRLSNIALAVVQEQVGHTSEAMSNVYTRLPESVRIEAARKWADVVDIRGRKASGGDGSG